MSGDETPPPRLNGNMIIGVLGSIAVAALTALVVLVLNGHSEIAIAAIVPTLGVLVTGVSSQLQGRRIEHNVNGNTTRLIETNARLSDQLVTTALYVPPPAHPMPPGVLTEQSPDPAGDSPPSDLPPTVPRS